MANELVFVKITYIGDIIWASWVPGHNYATRGTMKLIDQLLTGKSLFDRARRKRFLDNLKKRFIQTSINKENKPSLRVAEKLKMEFHYYYNDSYVYELKYPVWWVDKNKQK